MKSGAVCGDRDLGGLGLGLGHLEGRFSCRTIDRHEIVEEIQRRVVFFNVIHQRGNIVLYAEENAARVHELDIDILQNTTPKPGVPGQVHRLLRRAGAFDRHGRLGEDRPAFDHLLNQLPGIEKFQDRADPSCCDNNGI